MASNKDLVRRFIDEVWNDHKPERAKHYYTSDCVVDESGSRPVRGGDEAATLIGNYQRAFPDIRQDIREIIAEGDFVASLIHVTGTHDGPLMGVPPTGRHVEIDLVELDRVQNGKIVWSKVTWNVASMVEQLGIDPRQMAAGAQGGAPAHQ